MDIVEVVQAKKRLSGVIHDIPLERSGRFSQMTDANIFLKCEHRQKTGSFKVRGAYNKIAILKKTKKITNVIASSAGNHAQGVAYAARENGFNATIVMPRSTPIAKVLATQSYGANVILDGDCYDDAYLRAKEIEKATGGEFIEPFNDDDVIAGQGTLGLEIINELDDVDMVVVPTGGGGLLAGIAKTIKSLKPSVKIIGVQAHKADAMVRSFHQKELVKLDTIFTIADGIAVKKPGDRTFELIMQNVDDMVTVTDAEIASTIIELIERTKQIVEPAGASSLAAVLHDKLDIKGKNVVCMLSGGNIDVGFIHKIIEKGLINRGRQIGFSILMLDIPGGLARLASIVAKSGANIISVRYDRTSAEIHINEVILHITCEVSGKEHGNKLFEDIEEAGYKILLS